MTPEQVSTPERVYLLLKRSFDISFSLASLIFGAPLFLVLAVAIKLNSSGPVLIMERRVGFHGRMFSYLRFRTMRIEPPELSTGPLFRPSDDARITGVGRFLRRTGLDEIPAFWNVLQGDMSIVGPRAALPFEIDHYSEKQRERLRVKPGITGYWQVFGLEKGIFDFKRMIEMDIEYVEKRSILLDLIILVRTVFIVMRFKDEY